MSVVVPLGSRWFIDIFQAIKDAMDSTIASFSGAAGLKVWKLPIAETAKVSSLNPAV